MANLILVYLGLFLRITIFCKAEEGCYTYSTGNYGIDLVKNWHFQYPWPPLPAGTTRFNMTIKGNKDAYVILSATPGGNPNDYETDGDVGTPKLVIGGRLNKESAFSCVLIDDGSHSNWQWFKTPAILNPDEAQEFYFEFDNNMLQVGVVGDTPSIDVSCNCARDIKYIGVATGHGGTAEWTYCGEYAICPTHSTIGVGLEKVQNTHFQYPWPKFPSGATRLEVSIKGTRDAYIILVPTPGGIPVDATGENGYLKIVIGGWGNSKSGYLCNSNQDWFSVDTPNILDPDVTKKFYIEFGGSNRVLIVGQVCEAPFINSPTTDYCTADVRYFGVASGLNGSAEWTYCEKSETTSTTVATRTYAFTTEPQHQFTECSSTSTTDTLALSTEDSSVTTKKTTMDVTLNYETSSSDIGSAIITEPQQLFSDGSTPLTADITLSTQVSSVTTENTITIITGITSNEDASKDIKSSPVTHFHETSAQSGPPEMSDVTQESIMDELLINSSFGQKIQSCEENEMCSDEVNTFYKTWDEFIAEFARELTTSRYKSAYFDSYVFSAHNDDTSDTWMYAISNDMSSYQYQLSIPSKAFAADSLIVASVLKFDHPSMKSDGAYQTTQMGSRVLSIIAVDKITKLKVPLKTEQMLFVTYTLSFAVEAGMNISCQYITSTGNWSNDGYWVMTSNDTHVTCGYEHITSFAVLMQVVDVGELPSIHMKILSYLSYITMSISMICLLAAICIYVISKLYRKTRIALHMNLAAALLAAQLLFVTGIDAKYKNSCIAVTVLLHYLWLVVFVWMLVEGVHLFLKVNPSISLKMKLSICMPIAWGIPLVIALITLGVRMEDYARDSEKCWLPIEGGVIWAFAAPALIITCVNIVFLVITISKFLALKTNMDKSKAARLKASLRAIAILAPILGITWVFGALQFDRTSSIVFSYLFTIGNGLQGLFVFIAQCFMDEDVRGFLRQKSGRGAVGPNPPTQETNG